MVPSEEGGAPRRGAAAGGAPEQATCEGALEATSAGALDAAPTGGARATPCALSEPWASSHVPHESCSADALAAPASCAAVGSLAAAGGLGGLRPSSLQSSQWNIRYDLVE